MDPSVEHPSPNDSWLASARQSKGTEMADQGESSRASRRIADQDAGFISLLSEGSAGSDATAASEEFLADVRLDQVIEAMTGDGDERDLVADVLRRRVRDARSVRYRQRVFADLSDAELFSSVRAFCAQLRQVHAHLRQIDDMRSSHQRAGWLLDAAVIYCGAVRSLAAGLDSAPVTARALQTFRDYLTGYLASAGFARLASETAGRRDDLARVTYLIKLRGPRIVLSRYQGEPDFSAEIAAVFERFRQGATKDYQVAYRLWPGMNHLGERILDQVAKLFAAEFRALSAYRDQHSGFLDAKVTQFAREAQFYLSYLDYVRPLRAAGLSFCLPEISGSSKQIFARDTFDLALAARRVPAGSEIVPNDFELAGGERILVVTGPNQGGKTTFARTFGQLHHLAAVGCPVPGSAARLFLPDQILTHFERQETLNLTGKLEDELVRIKQILHTATPDSIVIVNEIFSSTTVSDALFLARELLAKIVELDLLCVYVTFIDELASYGATVVSMASTVDPGNPAERTYKVLRRPADGLAHALAIARKHHVSYEQLRGRMSP